MEIKRKSLWVDKKFIFNKVIVVGTINDDEIELIVLRDVRCGPGDAFVCERDEFLRVYTPYVHKLSKGQFVKPRLDPDADELEILLQYESEDSGVEFVIGNEKEGLFTMPEKDLYEYYEYVRG